MRLQQVGCISYYSYIKPQHNRSIGKVNLVVYRTIPTSNHNLTVLMLNCFLVVYRTIPTSNHNLTNIRNSTLKLYIVLFLHQTTTTEIQVFARLTLYIVLFLHQTTTEGVELHAQASCISYYSYIKPQHKERRWCTIYGCISYYSYIKPQHKERRWCTIYGCISYYSYIKPQLQEVKRSFQ